jgi:hypothetical protein
MSVKLANDAMRRFIASREPAVLCVRGEWGVGKTFGWKKQLQEAQNEHAIGLPRYAYVSLFGLSSLDDLRASMVANSVRSNQIDVQPSLETLQAALRTGEQFARRQIRILGPMASNLPWVGKFLGAATPAIFLSVKETLICIDDIERKSAGLSITDVLGLASYLKEQRSCRIVLLLNDGALSNSTLEGFQRLFEKVVDISIRYEPTPAESAGIALPQSDDLRRIVFSYVVALGLTNIRVIRKLDEYVRLAATLLKEMDIGVLRQAASTIILFGWSIFQPDKAPSLQFLLTKRQTIFGVEPTNGQSPEEISWNALLTSYGFGWIDEFDHTLIDGLQRGYFDPVAVDTHARPIHKRFLESNADASFQATWDLFHGSFDNNEEELLDQMYNSFMENYQYISPTNLNGTVSLFKKLGRAEQATEMIERYVSNEQPL